MAENKVQFGLKNVHYAVLTDAGTMKWETPKAVPGAVTLTLDQAGSIDNFYADNLAYFVSNSNQGYTGSLEMARFTDEMLGDIWGMTIGTTSKVLTENADAAPKQFALLYQIDGDANNQYYVIYNCTATRPGAGSTTITDTKEPQTQSCDLTAVPMANGMVMARTTAETPTETVNAWFTAVFVEGATK